MQSLWKLVSKPRIDDWSPLAKFYYADEALNAISNELDAFDGRRDPERCNHLVNKLRHAQDRVLHIITEMLIIVFPHEADRACRDFRVKFPDEIIHDNLPGQLWFGAECLAAGSNIVDHEAESEVIRPMAKSLTKHLDKMREMLREQALKNPAQYTDKIKSSLKTFDHLFAEFEFNYVSAMVPVKSVKEYDAQLDVAVLFSESLTRAIKMNYIFPEEIDDCDPNVIISLPRLAILWGLLYYPEGSLNVNGPKEELLDMFCHFHKLLVLIRNLLVTLTPNELRKLEMSLVTGNSSASNCDHSSLRIIENEMESMPEALINTATKALMNDSSTALNYVSPNSSTGAGSSEAILLSSVNEKNICDRSLYVTSENLIHRLFVCISGVADQLQTNYSSDIRKVLKMVLQPVEVVPVFEINGKTAALPENEEETGIEVQESLPLPSFVGVRWVPDNECDQCVACESLFTMVRRRHHCRNCGRIFCARCSANSIAIPELGYDKKVRVCNLCFLFRLNPFSTPTSVVQSTSAALSENVLAESHHRLIPNSDVNFQEQSSSSLQHDSPTDKIFLTVSASSGPTNVSDVLNSKVPSASSSRCATELR